jgi:hypothetical protein
MLTGYNSFGYGIAAFHIAMNTMLTLRQKGLLTTDETNFILEHALLNLETHEMKAPEQDRQSSRDARELLEGLRKEVSLPEKDQRPS